MKTQAQKKAKLFEETDNVGALYFDLNSYEGRRSMRQALAASGASAAFHEIDQEVFRKRIKYMSDQFTDKEYQLLETLRSEIGAIIEEYCPELRD